MSAVPFVASLPLSGIEPFATPVAFRHAPNASRGACQPVCVFVSCSSLASRESTPLPLPPSWFLVYDDEAGVGLVSVPLNRVEMPLAVFRFAFLGEVDSMAFGVHGVRDLLPSLSEGAFITSNSTPVHHFGHQNGHHEGLSFYLVDIKGRE